MFCESMVGFRSPMGFHQSGCCCAPHGCNILSPDKEREMLESLKRDLEDEISRVEARIQKIKK
jgi:hypothetical protein